MTYLAAFRSLTDASGFRQADRQAGRHESGPLQMPESNMRGRCSKFEL